MGLMTGYDGALPNPRGVKLTYDDFVRVPDDATKQSNSRCMNAPAFRENRDVRPWRL